VWKKQVRQKQVWQTQVWHVSSAIGSYFWAVGSIGARDRRAAIAASHHVARAAKGIIGGDDPADMTRWRSPGNDEIDGFGALALLVRLHFERDALSLVQ
jgi:hypothetical protein